MSLLPPNASVLEHGLELATERASAVTVNFAPLWDPETCPLNLLPYLAWALSIDGWNPEWPEAVRRASVAQSIALHRRKGTVSSVRDVVTVFGAQIAIKEWWQLDPPGTPHTFDIVLNLPGEAAAYPADYVADIIDEIGRTKPVRSHFTFSLAIAGQATLSAAAGARTSIFRRIAAGIAPLELVASLATVAGVRPASLRRLAMIAP